MDTLTKNPDPEFSRGGSREQFLPPESPLSMSKQRLRAFQRGEVDTKAGLTPVAIRRACIFAGTAAMTSAGCYEMYEVLQVGGVTILEWMVLALFVLLFACGSAQAMII